MARGYFQMGNRSIEDRRLYYSTRHVYAVMLAYRSKAGTVCKSLERLAALAHCSVATARQAVDQLMEYGYLRRIRRTRYSRSLDRMVNDTYRYQINPDKLTEGGLHADSQKPAGAEGYPWHLCDRAAHLPAGRTEGPGLRLPAAHGPTAGHGQGHGMPCYGGSAADQPDGAFVLPEDFPGAGSEHGLSHQLGQEWRTPESFFGEGWSHF